MFALGREKCEELAEGMQRLWQRHLGNKPNRQRAPEGRLPDPDRTDKLAFILFSLKVYPSFDVLGVFSDINGPESRHWVHKLMPLLEELLGQKLILPKRKIDLMEALIAAFPQAAEVILGGMECPIQRPKKRATGSATPPKEAAHAQSNRHSGRKAPDRLPFSE
jgi:hypothetical protein